MQARRLLPLVCAALALGCKLKPTGEALPGTPDAKDDEPRLPELYDVDCKPDLVDSACGKATYPDVCSCMDRNSETERVDELYQQFAWDAFIKLHPRDNVPLWTDWDRVPVETAEQCVDLNPNNPWLGNPPPPEGTPDGPPLHNPIWDQNGNPVKFEVRFIKGFSGNAEALETITNQVVESTNSALHSSNWGDLSEKRSAAMRLKLAWKELNKDERKHGNFILDESGSRGLVALHIAMVTMSTRGWWVWATFGHVDNAPDADNGDKSRSWLFFDTRCRDGNCPSENECPTNCDPMGKTCKTQIRRSAPIPEKIRKLNRNRHEDAPVRGTPLKNYQLIGVQRIKDALKVAFKDFDRKHLSPDILANEIIEWDRQKASSCIGCHVGMESWGLPEEHRPIFHKLCDGPCKCEKDTGGRTAKCGIPGGKSLFEATLGRHKIKSDDKQDHLHFSQADMFGLYQRITE